MPPSNRRKKPGSAPAFQAWHPNFRNTDELPDTKTVRTKFFVNSAMVALALCAALYYFYIEYNIRTLHSEIRVWDEQIGRDSKPSKDAIALYKKFKDEESKIKEVEAFIAGDKFIYTDFIAQIGQTLPDHVSVLTIQYRELDVSMKGVVKGAPELASGIASGYEKKLREIPEIGSKFSSISLIALSADNLTGLVNFDIVLKFKK